VSATSERILGRRSTNHCVTDVSHAHPPSTHPLTRSACFDRQVANKKFCRRHMWATNIEDKCRQVKTAVKSCLVWSIFTHPAVRAVTSVSVEWKNVSSICSNVDPLLSSGVRARMSKNIQDLTVS